MSDTKHTPGPWTVDEEAFDNDGFPETVIRGLGGIAGVAVAIDFGSNNPKMRHANARLIAAAPDMLTALETVLAGGHLNTGEQAIVANAIAKATGKSIGEVLRVGG